MEASEICEMCAEPVAPQEAYRAEVTVDGLMCPTPMTFHQACYEQASHLWKPVSDSICQVDPDYPETQQWTPASPYDT